MVSGHVVTQRFFETAVKAIVADVMGGDGYVAGRLGSGSDVLGFDDGRSHDHDFGCRLTVLVDDAAAAVVAEIDTVLEDRLPDEVDGWPTRFATTWDERVSHKVDVHTVHDFAKSRLGVDLRSPLTVGQWLCLTGQSVLEVSGGPVFHDTTTAYARVCDSLRWYPEDVWLYTLAAGWTRLSQELPFVGRTGELGDDVGSPVIAARLCRDIMHLAFLVERVWMPYPKWQGTALSRLSFGAEMVAVLSRVLSADDWRTRQRHMQEAIEILAERHRQAGFDLPEPAVHQFFERPALVTHNDIPAVFTSRISDGRVLGLPPIGSIEQWCDNVDILAKPERRANMVAAYDGLISRPFRPMGLPRLQRLQRLFGGDAGG